MPSYLVVKHSGSNASIQAKNEEPGKPYLKIKDGYFPLTSETSGTGLYAKVSGSNYKVAETSGSYTTTSTTTSSSTYYTATYSEIYSGIVTEYEITGNEVNASVYYRLSKISNKATCTGYISVHLPPRGSISVSYTASGKNGSFSRANALYTNYSNYALGTFTCLYQTMVLKASFKAPEVITFVNNVSSITENTVTYESATISSYTNSSFSFYYTRQSGSANVNRTFTYKMTTNQEMTYLERTLETKLYNDYTVTETYSVETTVTVE